MEVLAMVLLLMGLFFTVVGIAIEDTSTLIVAGVCYLYCWKALTRMSKERGT